MVEIYAHPPPRVFGLSSSGQPRLRLLGTPEKYGSPPALMFLLKAQEAQHARNTWKLPSPHSFLVCCADKQPWLTTQEQTQNSIIGSWGSESNRGEIGFVSFVRACEAVCKRASECAGGVPTAGRCAYRSSVTYYWESIKPHLSSASARARVNVGCSSCTCASSICASSIRIALAYDIAYRPCQTRLLV